MSDQSVGEVFENCPNLCNYLEHFYRFAALAYFLTCIVLYENKIQGGYDKIFMIRIIFVIMSGGSPITVAIHNIALGKVSVNLLL